MIYWRREVSSDANDGGSGGGRQNGLPPLYNQSIPKQVIP